MDVEPWGEWHGDDAVPAREQLYDELIARAWSLRWMAPSTCDPSSPRVRAALARAANRTVARLGTSGQSAVEVCRVLWPGAPPPPPDDPWWATPLGRLLAGALHEVAS